MLPYDLGFLRQELHPEIAAKTGLRGGFRLFPGDPEREIFIPNQITLAGEQSFLAMICQDSQTDIAANANFYVGLCSGTFDKTTTLSGISGEPSATNGYARQSAARNSTGWPQIVQVNNVWRAQTQVLNFTATGGNFSAAITRTFLCNVLSGTSGKLFAVSGAFQSAVLVVQNQTLPAQYELYLN